MDDVAPPRPEQESEPKRSIFDGGRGSDFGGRSVGTVGSQRTKFGRKVAELCNALTGGFGDAGAALFLETCECTYQVEHRSTMNIRSRADSPELGAQPKGDRAVRCEGARF